LREKPELGGSCEIGLNVRKMVETIVKAISLDKNDRRKEVLAVEPLQGKHEQIPESVMRCQVNLGHPSRERFLHLLKSAGASEKAIL